MRIPQVTTQNANDFHSTWTHNGVTIFMDPVHLKFATDFANSVLVDFMQHLQRQAAEAAKPMVTLG